MAKQLILDVDVNKMTWKKYKLFVSLSKKLTALTQTQNEEELIPVLEEFVTNFSDWTVADIEQLTVAEFLQVFNSLKGGNQNPPLES